MGLTLLGWLEDVGNHIVAGILGPILWGLCDIFFVIINLCEGLFRKFAGLDVVYSRSGEAIEGDIVLYLLQDNVVQDIFFSILILSFFLLIIFTIFAIVKNQYVEKPKPVMNIINASVKGLLQYLMVPVCVVVGLAVGNVILQAVDGATKSGATSASGMLFKAAASNANKVQTGTIDKRRDDLKYLLDIGQLDEIAGEIAVVLNCSSNTNALIKASNFATEGQLDRIASIIDEAFVTGQLTGTKIYTAGSVAIFYDFLSISYITVWVGGAFLCYCLIMITWGLLGRIFKMVISYVLTPALIAMYPMDDGNGLKTWIKYFSKEATMAYCAVAVVNVFYSILPFVRDVDLFRGNQWNPGNQVVQLLITISGYMLVKSFIATVSSWFNTGDAYAAGSATKVDVGKVAGKITTGAFKGVSGAVAGAKYAKEHGADTKKGKFFGALTGAYASSGLQKKFDVYKYADMKKTAEDDAEKFYQKIKTTNPITGEVNKKVAAEFKGREIVGKQQKKLSELISKYEAETDEIVKARLLKQIEQNSAHVQEALKEVREKLNIRTEKNESADKRIRTTEQVTKMGSKLYNMAQKILGKEDIAQADMTKLMRGDTSILKTDKQKEMWSMYQDTFIATTEGYKEAQSEVTNLRAVDAEFDEMIRTSFPDIKTAIPSFTENWRQILREARLKREAVNTEFANIKSESKKVNTEKVLEEAKKQRDELMDPKDYQNIGKSSDSK